MIDGWSTIHTSSGKKEVVNLITAGKVTDRQGKTASRKEVIAIQLVNNDGWGSDQNTQPLKFFRANQNNHIKKNEMFRQANS